MKTIESYGKPDAGNIVIEADNLDALKALGEEYTGKIDVITIDPPYNTDISYIGYKDSDYSEGWGKFMGDRLSLAKGLLSPTGVMFINIDENEYTAHFDAGCGKAVDLITGNDFDFGGGTRLEPYSVKFLKCEH